MPKNLTSSQKKLTKKKSPATTIKIDKANEDTTNVTSNRARKRTRGLTHINYRLWRKDRKEHIAQQVRLPNVWGITAQAARLLWQNKGLFAGIILIYGVLNLILVKGLYGSTDVSSLKSELSQVFTGNLGNLASGLTIFAVLVGSSGSGTTNTAGAYQIMLLLLVSLAIIWALRQVLAGTRPRVRDAYYRGMYPLIPFVIVILVIMLQLIPLVLGSAIYSQVLSNGIAVGYIEKALWFGFFIVMALWSLYMISASLFALYIVTLPDMTPLSALRSARKLVRHRRWTALLKVLFLPVMLLVIGMVIVLPVIAIAAPLAQWVFLILSLGSVAAVHAYMYGLYRELLREKQSAETVR